MTRAEPRLEPQLEPRLEPDSRQPEPVAPAARVRAPSTLAGEAVAVTPIPAPEESPPQPTAAREPASTPAAAVAPAPVAPPPPLQPAAAAPVTAAAPKLPALSGELELLSDAQRALREDQLSRALALLDQHAARYPRGALTPERLAARAVVLCRMGDAPSGRAEARRLEASAPSSPLIAWVRSRCGY